jgi:hypothetical protein
VTAELHIAYVWDCDACGRENFERAMVYEFSPEEIAEGEYETGNWMTHPDSVICRGCGAVFDAKHFCEDES